VLSTLIQKLRRMCHRFVRCTRTVEPMRSPAGFRNGGARITLDSFS